MVCIRQATSDDLLQMQSTNLWCLPENYQVCMYVYWDLGGEGVGFICVCIRVSVG